MWSDLEGQIEKIIQEVIELVYFMRGSVSMDEAYEFTRYEKSLISKFLENRFKNEINKSHPIY